MGPKTFIPCYVCLKEFGSRSIPFHESKCLERWRSSNRTRPLEKRAHTPVKHSADGSRICTNCQASVSNSDDRAAECSTIEKPKPRLDGPRQSNLMTGVSKTEFSPKAGKENKNVSSNIAVQGSHQRRRHAKKDAKGDDCCQKEPTKEVPESIGEQFTNEKVSDSSCVVEVARGTENGDAASESTTSKRSVRPQTKILRRPTPNLRHPVIQVDSDDSGDCSDKSKDENPKRLKTGDELQSAEPKPKNFVMYNKHNVDKNTKNGFKERSNAAIPVAVPNPCNSCSRSVAPERLHSHVGRDARGLMLRRAPSVDVKVGGSPQKKRGIPAQVKPAKDTNESESKDKVLDSVDKDDTARSKLEVHHEEENEPQKECYICEGSFGISLLLLHEGQCLQLWKKENNGLPPNLRKLPPRKPECVENLRIISDPAWTVVQSQLIPCSLCRRTFFPERLPVHQRVCKGKQSPQPLKRASSLREQSATRRDGDKENPTPLYVPCYICGRNYGSWVIPMHESQCLRKWRKENEKLPETFQDEEPLKPEESTDDLADDLAGLVELGDNAWESHLQKLVPCSRCKRTFFPDRLEVHGRSCKGPSCNRRPRSNNGA